MSGKALIWGAMWKVSEREGFDLGGDVEGEWVGRL